MIELNHRIKLPLNVSEQNFEDLVTIIWFSKRYNPMTVNITEYWKNLENQLLILELDSLPSRILAFLYEAITREIKSPDPNLLFDLYPFSKQLKEISESHFKNRKFVSAIFEATKKLNEIIQNKTGVKNKSEVDLVQSTMNPRNPKLVFNSFINESSGKNEQAGLQQLLMGIFKAFRNPKGHKPEDHPMLELDPYEALAQLIIIDYMIKRIEKAQIKD